jgi:uncharacterized protein (TIGR02217 family)
MSITVLSNVIAPNSLWSAGARGKQMRRNTRVQVQSGQMQINVGWSRTLRQYEIDTVPLSVEQWQSLEGLHEVTEGGAYGFLLQDPKDCSASDTTGKATLISAPAHTYQLIKRYTSVGSSQLKDRVITRPRAAGFVLKISGTPTLSYTLDPDTGVIIIPADPSALNVSWSGLFYVPVHFDTDEIDWELARAGAADGRLMAGPSLVLTEVSE